MKANIRHLIVLMLENRAFDHMLGYLEYPPEKQLEAIQGKEAGFGNRLDDGTTQVFPRPGAKYLIEPDPEHSHASVMTQLYGPDWRSLPHDHSSNNGFAVDFQQKLDADPQQVIECFTPDQVPVLSTLAQEFAVFDHWHCSVPGATWPNRNFTHAATSDGNVDIVTRLYTNPTVYERLTAAGKDWAVYYGGFPPQSFAFEALWKKDATTPSWMQRFKPIRSLYRAIETDHLPQYAFVEPDMLGLISDSQHPGMGGVRDFRAGEHLIWSLYETLRQNPEIFEKTLFLITYDEHGGFFDHVAPPRGEQFTVRPFPDGAPFVYHDPKSNYEFRFDMLGLRVPAVLVSPWVERGTVDHTLYDHTSIPATVRDLFGPFDPLTTRDHQANSFAHSGVLSRTEPRREDLPVIAEPAVFPPVKEKSNKLELRDSLAGLLRLTWDVIGDAPGDFLSRFLKSSQDPQFFGMAGPGEVEEDVKEEVSQEILPELSPEAQALLAEEMAKPSPEFEPTGAIPSPLARALDVLKKLSKKLEDNERVDDLQKFVDMVLRKYYMDPNFILIDQTGQAILIPDEARLTVEIGKLYSDGKPGNRIWLADWEDRWLTLYSGGRLRFDDLDKSFGLPGVTEEQANAVFQQMLGREAAGVRSWFESEKMKMGGAVGHGR